VWGLENLELTMRATRPALISPPRFFSPSNPLRRLPKAARLAFVAAGALVGLSSAAHAVVDISCQGGPGMTANRTQTRLEIGFMIGEGEQPNPGECILPGRGLLSGEKPLLLIPLVANANLVEMAAKGGTFDLKAQESQTGFRVTFIGQVNVVDATPLSPGPEGAGEPAGGGEEGGGMAGGGEEGGGLFVPSADCPAGTATVKTPEGLDFLNIREQPSLDAKVLAQAPNQSEVTVLGACLKAAAGLTKQKVQIPLHDWCRISSPKEGCVKAEFLVFGDHFPPGAGLVKPKKKKH
jgi:hypothetical protein